MPLVVTQNEWNNAHLKLKSTAGFTIVAQANLCERHSIKSHKAQVVY